MLVFRWIMVFFLLVVAIKGLFFCEHGKTEDVQCMVIERVNYKAVSYKDEDGVTHTPNTELNLNVKSKYGYGAINVTMKTFYNVKNGDTVYFPLTDFDIKKYFGKNVDLLPFFERDENYGLAFFLLSIVLFFSCWKLFD